jgi:hypothetical protein
MRVRRFLDLSTAHLDEESRDWLELRLGGNGMPNEPVFNDAATEVGWWMWVPSEEKYERDDTPGALRRLFLHALALGCDYILFDRDAEPSPALPTFDW